MPSQGSGDRLLLLFGRGDSGRLHGLHLRAMTYISVRTRAIKLGALTDFRLSSVRSQREGQLFFERLGANDDYRELSASSPSRPFLMLSTSSVSTDGLNSPLGSVSAFFQLRDGPCCR